MDNPKKPERVEVGTIAEDEFGYPAACLWCGGDLGIGAYQCMKCEDFEGHPGEYSRWTAEWRVGKRDFPRRAPAPATPGTATPTPAATARPLTPEAIERGRAAIKRLADKFVASPALEIPAEFRYGGLSASAPRWYVGIDCGAEASKPPAAPVYGRLVGELRAPDGTPLSALEAIRARREPEPWLPSCDIDCDIPDADEGRRR